MVDGKSKLVSELMGLDREQLETLIKMIKARVVKQLSFEEVQKLIQLDTLDDCKQYLRVMLDFYFDVIKSPEGRKATSYIEDDRNIWMQTLFSEGFHFLSLLDGIGYNFSLHGHPSYVSIFQFRDAFKNDNRADTSIMAPHATQCVLAFMSIFIVDYMKLVPEIKSMYDKLEEPRRFAIGMYEDAMRGEKKFKLLEK